MQAMQLRGGTVPSRATICCRIAVSAPTRPRGRRAVSTRAACRFDAVPPDRGIRALALRRFDEGCAPPGSLLFYRIAAREDEAF
ncbi:hypothetical protein J5226_14765 [Lysobacter sp. K5869]|uniref:hypothetical protein n=1 Tax=Lysobacter sp. K5869 TaxID=2820808 RepID=UPI001C06247E|nr:hypothetical protein [Lysobacter sp. K5869]QWP74919.1 hypothetical protein J5226_14765 [Lysobacter sp. K5869]